jgi:hypothetical protein
MVCNSYLKLIGTNIKNKDKLVCFPLVRSEQLYSIVDYVCSKKNLKATFIEVSDKKHARIKVWERNPINWLKQIASASFVISDSFHGVVFAILFKKNFIALCVHEQKFVRIKDLLTNLGLEHKIVLSIQKLEENYMEILKEIDYKKIEIILERKRKEFIDFLNSSLN